MSPEPDSPPPEARPAVEPADLKPEGDEAHALAEKWLSEPMIVATSLAIFALCAVVFEWKTIWDAVVALLPAAWRAVLTSS